MGSFLLRRTLQLLFVLWWRRPSLHPLQRVADQSGRAVHVGSGDRARSAGRRQPGTPDGHRQALQQYLSYMSGLLHGDLGTSYVTKEPVSDIVRETLPPSLRLATWAIVVESP